jgi:hypothetical protein
LCEGHSAAWVYLGVSRSSTWSPSHSTSYCTPTLASLQSPQAADEPPPAVCCRSIWWREVFPKYDEGKKKTLYMKIWTMITQGKLELNAAGKPST